MSGRVRWWRKSRLVSRCHREAYWAPGLTVPNDGNHRRENENTARRIMPTQNSGADRTARTSGMPMDSITVPRFQARSEEHTSELQSLTNLVCRLLLEKKKTLK